MKLMERLNKSVMEKGPLLAGLDPDMEKLRALSKEIGYKGTDCDFLRDYCFEYIKAVKDTVVATKINIAFFEACEQLNIFWEVAEKTKEEGLFVIADVKRADIGNTSAKYAEAFLYGNTPIDAITINPYFGTDGVKPFLDMAAKNDKGVFVLAKTSNPSSDEIQNLVTEDGEKVYQKVGHLVDCWGRSISSETTTYNPVGAVVGATHPTEAKELRDMLPNTFFLVPGYGAQGATAKDIVVNFDSKGGGAVVNSSRGLMFAYKNERWAQKYSSSRWADATHDEAERAQKELAEAIKNHK
jgi:orotidine 5'-phosphate decarboxylase